MKKFLSLILCITIMCSSVACGKKNSNTSNADEQFNLFLYTRMSNGVLYYGKGTLAEFLDYNTMESTSLCNIPNCNHMTSQCLVNALDSSGQLPVIYNNCAYYFSNYWGTITNDEGLRAYDLEATILKYDFNKMEISKVTQIEGYMANEDDGSYLIGNEYYFTTNNGEPYYDEEGNVSGGGGGGQAKVYSINLDTEEVTDYGEVFEYQPDSKVSTRTRIFGKDGDKLYLVVSRVTTSMICTEKIYSFDTKTHKIEEVCDGYAICAGDGYMVYYSVNGSFETFDLSGRDEEFKMWLKDTKTGEVIEGPVIGFDYQHVSIFNNKVWFDGTCYDIATNRVEKVTDLISSSVQGIYDNHYIISGLTADEEKLTFEKIPCEEIDSLFE